MTSTRRNAEEDHMVALDLDGGDTVVRGRRRAPAPISGYVLKSVFRSEEERRE
jgi:hypothetical protein